MGEARMVELLSVVAVLAVEVASAAVLAVEASVVAVPAAVSENIYKQ